jgi:predicted small secreted protein
VLKSLTLFLILFLFGCNTVIGTAKGVGRDIKAVTVYSRDSIIGNPISDESSK